ncbi:MAG TPA: metalloregulator ArsR/SmtB family transcription factor [Candidatus Dormibacteraeota bacterium]
MDLGRRHAAEHHAVTSPAAKADLFDGFARVAQALGSGRRVEILDILANGERTVESLAKTVGLTVANTSQHLQILRRAGLVSGRRDGNHIRYGLAGDDVFSLWSTLRSVASTRLAEIERLAAAYLGDRETLEPVTRDELFRRLREKPAPIVLDVRPAEEYQSAHVAGAVSIPLAELRKRLRDVPKEREIVAYCRGPYCVYAHEAVRLLRSRGYSARRLQDGLPEWAAAGLPLGRGAGVARGSRAAGMATAQEAT